DVTQEICLRGEKALPSDEPARASLRTWLTKLAVNACQTHRRRNFLHRLWRHTAPTPAPDDGWDLIDTSPWGAPEDEALRNEVRLLIRKVLNEMRPEHRTVLILHYYLDLPCAEIARVVDCPEGTVYSRLHYARRV